MSIYKYQIYIYKFNNYQPLIIELESLVDSLETEKKTNRKYFEMACLKLSKKVRTRFLKFFGQVNIGS